MIPIISGLTIKLHAVENLRRLNFNLTFAVVYGRLSVSVETVELFNSRNHKCPPFSLLRNFVSFVSKCPLKTLEK